MTSSPMPPHAKPRRALSLAALGLAAALLGACAALPTPPAAPALYDFSVAAAEQQVDGAKGAALADSAAAAAQSGAQQQQPAPAPAQSAAPLLLGKISAHGLPANSQAVLYRYAYADAQQLRAYQQARWSQPVPQLLGQQLRQQLELRRPVLEDGFSPARLRQQQQAPLALQVDVLQFEQVFTSETQSHAQVRLRATLWAPQPQGDRLLGQRTFEYQRAAPTPDAAGGAWALAQAAQAAVSAIDVWLSQMP
ncbi:MAG: ABC-type transport auxiliary lipoprotein family protein [Comamonadaceae bacterium]|nr:ABC-type transport auxiliary lipoprotein family protein [Comamonadaceae bacterium]